MIDRAQGGGVTVVILIQSDRCLFFDTNLVIYVVFTAKVTD